MFAYIDGDDIGLKIENSFMNNDEISMKLINKSVKNIVEEITRYLDNNGHEIIFSAADGIICKKEDIDSKKLMNYIRTLNLNYTFSIGTGNSLREAYIALRYAKANGKNIISTFFYNEFNLIK